MDKLDNTDSQENFAVQAKRFLIYVLIGLGTFACSAVFIHTGLGVFGKHGPS